ncbi:MAG: peptidase domain-containing ABC transporter [Bacteroidales bacterium]|nr:peptidase domain-containing ABC transporter [Bacteroidales bacterium]
MGINVKQHDITDCGAACLASIASHYRLKLPISRIRQMAGTDKKGTNVLGLLRAAEKLGFTAKGVKGKMESIPKIPLPAIAHVIVDKVLHHYVVIYKATDKAVEIMDPREGKMNKLSKREFAEQWTGVLVLMVPNEDFRKMNMKVSNFARFLFLLSPHKSILLQALFGAIIYTLLGLSTAIYIQKITDHVLVDGNRNLLNLLSLAMVFILFFQIFIGVTKTIFTLQTGQKIDARLIMGYYKHLLKLPQRFFDTMRVGEIISRINDAVKIRHFINDTLITLIVNIFIILFAFGLMFIYNWKLALIVAIILPLYLLTYSITNRLNKKQERKIMVNGAEVESQLVESLNSVKTIKQFGLENHTNLKTETRFVNLLRSIYTSGLNSVFSSNTSEFLNRSFTIILLWVGSYFVIDRLITPGELLSFYALIGYFTGPAIALVGMNKTIQNALIAADRLFEIMDLEREEESNQMELTGNMTGDIQFENISFSYGTRIDVFKDFNLTIEKGKITAIIGESGSGKSTLTYLVQKLYPLNEGVIRIGQYNIQYISTQSLRNLIGVVPQQLNIFSGNVTENIAVGETEPDMEKVIRVCSQLKLIEFIEQLPNGFHTWLGENGATLSGGQKQRLAIARALYKEPEILILDEASSNLDSEAEYHVKQTVHHLRDQGKTVILIAHRLSTLAGADTIVVLEKGRVTEQGSHEALYDKKGRYYQLWQKQIPSYVNQNI